jgi:hypothetical protein
LLRLFQATEWCDIIGGEFLSELLTCNSIDALQELVDPMFQFFKKRVTGSKVTHSTVSKLFELLSSEYHAKVLLVLRLSQVMSIPFQNFNVLVDSGNAVLFLFNIEKQEKP